MPRLTYLTEADAHVVAERLTANLFRDTPAFRLLGDSGKERLLSALAQPRWSHHRTLPTKAAALHYHLNKAHAYADGNKRLALTASEYFLAANGALLFASPEELRDLALGVASNGVSQDQNRTFFVERCFRSHWTPARRAIWVRGLSEEGRRAVRLEDPVERLRDALTATVDQLTEELNALLA